MGNETTVGSFCPFTYGKGLPAGRRNTAGSIPVYGSNGIVGWHDEPYTKGPTVIIGRKGTVGAVHYSSTPCWPIDTTFFIEFSDPQDARFTYYLLKTLGLEHMNSDSAVPGLNRNAAHLRKIPLFEKTYRHAISNILGALDDKIELNRQMCKTLEDTAQAIFKSWFVDFDPVHAKAAGKQPEGLNPEIAALFPDSFEDSELGKIPKGWRVSAVEDVINRIPVGKKYEQKTANSKGQVPILDQGQSGIIGYHDNEPGVIANRDKPIIVFANHTCYMRLIYFPFSAIQNVLPFVGNGINTIWLYYATLGKQTFIEYKGHWPDLMRQQIYVPNMSLDERYSEIVTPLLFKMWCCIEENNTLGSIRDSLLPRLISGELKVKDAEKIASRLV